MADTSKTKRDKPAADQQPEQRAAGDEADAVQRKSVTDANLQRLFETMPLSEEQDQQAAVIQRAAAGFAQTIVDQTMNGPHRQHALRQVSAAYHAALDAVRMRGR